MTFRTERDPLGELNVPADTYYGVQTARAVDNFQISDLRAPADLVTATILIKKAAAQANPRRKGRMVARPAWVSAAALAITMVARVPGPRTTRLGRLVQASIQPSD